MVQAHIWFKKSQWIKYLWSGRMRCSRNLPLQKSSKNSDKSYVIDFHRSLEINQKLVIIPGQFRGKTGCSTINLLLSVAFCLYYPVCFSVVHAQFENYQPCNYPSHEMQHPANHWRVKQSFPYKLPSPEKWFLSEPCVHSQGLSLFNDTVDFMQVTLFSRHELERKISSFCFGSQLF